MKAPPLSTAPTPAPISPPHAQDHLPIGAPPDASVERCRMAISAAPPPCGAIGENLNDLLSLSLSLCAIMTTSLASEWPRRPHGRESTMD
jgi:hypothetical protein